MALHISSIVLLQELQYCQAQQASTQLKLSFVLFTFSPATHPPTRESIIQTKINLDLKSKVFSLNGKTLETSSDINPISHGTN